MYLVYLAGGIASGKSTVAQELERRGAVRIDLDAISREVLEPGSLVLERIAQSFGEDVLDQHSGKLNRSLLAERAFATPEKTALLEELELPAIRERLLERIEDVRKSSLKPSVCVVEVPLLNKLGEILGLADEIVCVCCPEELRLERAVERGMKREDARARIARQASEQWLREQADSVIENLGSQEELMAELARWWDAHERAGWASPKREEVPRNVS